MQHTAGVGRTLRVVAIVCALTALFIAFAPFRSRGIVGATEEYHDIGRTSLSCRPPVIDAWRGDRTRGWFGYAPLTETPELHDFADCRRDARPRLVLALGVLLVAVALAATATRLRHRDLTTRQM